MVNARGKPSTTIAQEHTQKDNEEEEEEREREGGILLPEAFPLAVFLAFVCASLSFCFCFLFFRKAAMRSGQSACSSVSTPELWKDEKESAFAET